MKQFFDNLKQEIQLAIEKDVKNIFCEIGKEKVYAIALVLHPSQPDLQLT